MSPGWGSLGMGQVRCVEGSGPPHTSLPATKGSTTWERQCTGSQISHGANARQQSEGRGQKGANEKAWQFLDFTEEGLQPFATQALCSKLTLLPLEDRQISKGPLPEPPRWGLSTWPERDKEQCKQHEAQIQTQSGVFPAWVLMQRLVVEDHPRGYRQLKGRSGRGSTGPGGRAG